MDAKNVAGSGSTVDDWYLSMVVCYYLILIMFVIAFVEHFSVLIFLKAYLRLFLSLYILSILLFDNS